VPLLSRALRHLSPELVPSCRTRCEHALGFHKSLSECNGKSQISYTNVRTFISFSSISVTYFPPILFVRPAMPLPLPSYRHFTLNIALNTHLQENYDKSMNHELFRLLLPVPSPLLKSKAQKMAFMVIR
jgi:hypothetical protein